jgi:large subunit ribosomal protein L19
MERNFFSFLLFDTKYLLLLLLSYQRKKLKKNMSEVETKKEKIFRNQLETFFSQNVKTPNFILDEKQQRIEVGDLVRINYLIPEGEKERIQIYEGFIISIKNRSVGKSFTLRRTVQGVGVEQVFLAYSPKILSILKKQSFKVRKAKLYFLRALGGKTIRLKRKI